MSETFYHFLHITIQEWLAAHYLAQLPFITWPGENYSNPQFGLVKQFVCGVNQFKSTSLRLFVPEIKYIFQSVHGSLKDNGKMDVKKLHINAMVHFQFGHPEIRQTLQPYDSMVLMYVLCNTSTLWKLAYYNFQLRGTA